MIRSCSDWMVPTMSDIRPVRLEFSAASRAPSPCSESSSASMSGVQDVVFNGFDVAALQDQVAAAADALPVERGGLVEVPGFGRTPVHHEPLQVLGGEADAANVLCLAGVQVQAAEDQPVVDGIQLRQAVLIQCRERVTFGNVLHGAHGSGPADLGQLAGAFPRAALPAGRTGRQHSPVRGPNRRRAFNVPLSRKTDRPFYNHFR